MKTRCTYKTFLAGMLVFTLISILNFDYSYAAESTLNLSIDDSAVKVNVAPTSTNGTFRKGTASTISASTNNATGYTLSISAPSASGSDYDKLINTADNTAKISSISSPTTEEQYKALNNTSYNNTWGYLPSKYCSDGTSTSCAANTSFLPAPTIAGDVLDQTTAANTTANTYTIGMGTRIDSTTKTGKYQGSFIVKLVANAIPYTITYIDDSVSNMPIDVDTTTPDTSVNISSTEPTRNGYTFIGWCTVTPTINADGTDTCSGTKYNAGATITINQTGTNNDFTLHAMWSENYSIANVTYMQDFASMTADKRSKVVLSMVPEQSYTIKDNRDETTYHIVKLKDGNVWLQDNLALDLTDSTVLNGMNESNTNASNTTLGYLKNGGGTNSDKYAITGVVNWTDSPSYASSNSYSDPLVNMTNKDIIPTDATSTSGGYKVGGYYNYCATTAGSYCYGNGTSEGTSSGNATEDICPKGWRMPTSNSGEYQTLYSNTNYNTYDKYREALRIPISGYFYNGSVRNQGREGVWWSSTRRSNFLMYLLRANTSSIDLSYSNNRSGSASIRCVLGS